MKNTPSSSSEHSRELLGWGMGVPNAAQQVRALVTTLTSALMLEALQWLLSAGACKTFKHAGPTRPGLAGLWALLCTCPSKT